MPADFTTSGAGEMKLRPYQQSIVEAVEAGLRDGGAGQVHMACGSGKTLVGQRAAEALLPAGATVAVVAPSLQLLAQTLNAWSQASVMPLDVIAVCSDVTITDSPVRTSDLSVPVTTDSAAIASWLERPPADGMGMRLVLCTYLSVGKLAEAVGATAPLDLLILDEAHHLTGRDDSPIRKLVLSGQPRSHRRLYMTGTPREDLRVAERNDGPSLVGMEDAEVFGPVLGRYTFAQGIAEGYLEDYRIAVIGVGDGEARKLLCDQEAQYVDAPGAPALQIAAAQIALGRAREQYGIKRALTFHPRVEGAAEFSRTLRGTLARVAPSVSDGLYAGHVHGEMDTRVRAQVLSHLAGSDDGWTVISSARCLGEGVDLPAVDAVLFAHPKRSAVDITQAVGRALRRGPASAGPSTVILPLVVPDEDGEVGDLEAGEYETLWQVVRALRAHDEALGIALDEQRHYDPAFVPELPGKITVVLPPGTSEAILSQVRLALVRQTTSPWLEGYHEAARYYAEHGHLLVPADHVTDRGFRLGGWIAQRRYNYRRNQLRRDRIDELNTVGMIWEPTAERFARNLQAAADYYAQHGNLRAPQGHLTSDGMDLGRWLSKQREKGAAGRLAPWRREALDAIGMEWRSPLWDELWEKGLAAASAYFREYGHLDVPRAHRMQDGYRLGDWLTTHRVLHRKGTLPPHKRRVLEERGMVWDKYEDRWQRVYAAAKSYHAAHRDLDVPHSYTTPDGVKLGSWILHQRQLRSGVKQGGITPKRVEALDAIGMRW